VSDQAHAEMVRASQQRPRCLAKKTSGRKKGAGEFKGWMMGGGVASIHKEGKMKNCSEMSGWRGEIVSRTLIGPRGT